MLEYTVIYSIRRTISLSFDKNGTLTVRAPKGTKKKRIEQILEEHQGWIEKHRDRARKKAESEASLTNERIRELKDAAKKYLIPMTDYYARLLGVSYGRVTITSARTRFGSCSSEGNISYSYRLMRFPPAAQEYVVVHELCHRIHMNHSAAFYKKIESVLPDYKKRKSLLKAVPE